MSSGGLIERQAIGRIGSIGALYNIRTDQFVVGNLLKTKLPKSLIDSTDCGNVKYWLDLHNSQKETLKNLNVEAGLKIGIMAGLLKVEGSAKYLNQTKTDSRTVRATFIYKMKTKQEDLLVSTEGLQEYFAPYAFENPDVTHVVIGVRWGANVAATFERTVEKSEDVQRIEGILSIAFGKPESGATRSGSWGGYPLLRWKILKASYSHFGEIFDDLSAILSIIYNGFSFFWEAVFYEFFHLSNSRQ